MKRKVSKLRLSPNEEARIIREELDRRRKLRIQQVREQQRQISLQIRRQVEQRRQQELRLLEEQLREDWERRQREKLHTLQSLYLESLRLVGQSHRSAKENEVDLAAAAQREEEHHAKAEERYREALKELKIQKSKEQERRKRSINARKKALQMEKERSAKVTSLPPPPPGPIQDIDPRKPHMVKRSDLNAFAATRYHMPESAVEKEPEAAQPDARLEADLESRRLQELQREEDRRREEQLEKARVRGRQALRREQLEQDRERLLVELQHLQQTDMLRRRQQVSQMPPQIFQPLYQRQEAREELQRELEFAFEDMYTGERRVKGDLVVQLVPEPLPATSSTGQDLDLDPDRDLDVTVDENAEAENIRDDFGDEVEGREQEAADGATLPRQALRKLLDRIRSQRTDWINGSSRVPAADSSSELIPERDTSIETGSLTPEPLSEPAAPTVDPTEPPPAAERSLPADFLSRIREDEEERKKREAELEVEKQQQLVLLQELEEQKAELERMLQEAQREREQLRAAAQQEALLLQPQGQDCFPISSEEEAAPAAEEDVSTRRLRQYQQRLLEQNRIHQRSVEVARQRLEEYQRALRIRHNLTAAAMLRPPVHPAFLAPPSHPETPSAASDVSLPAFSSSAGSSAPSDPSVTNWISAVQPDAAARLADSQSMLPRVAKLLPDRLRASAAGPGEPQASHRSAGTSATFDPVTLTSREVDRRRRELQEAQRRAVEQRAALVLQKEQQEEERRRAEEELQQMRRQKEALQALIDADRRSGSDSPREASDPQEAERKRLQLLASLLRAIEESNGGSLSHLEDPEEGADSLQPDVGGRAPLVPSADPPEPAGLLHPARAQKPPVTRVKLGFDWMIPHQHELSAIQEVETPVNLSRLTGCRPDSAERRLTFSATEDNDPSHLQESPGLFSTSDPTLESGSVSSCRPSSAGRRVVSSGPEDGAPSLPADFNLQDSSADRTAGSLSASSCRPGSAWRRVAFSGPEDDVPPLPPDFNLRFGSARRRVVFSDTEDDMRSGPADGNLQDGSVPDSRQSGSVSSCRSDSAGRRVAFSGPEDDVPSRLSDVILQDGSVESRVVSEHDFPLLPADFSLQDDSVSLPWSDRTLESGSASSFRTSSAGRRVVSSGPEDGAPSLPADFNLQDGSVESRVGSETSCRLPWRERLLSGAATTPESSDSDSAMKAPPGSGRGAESPGPAAVGSRSPSEAPCRFAGSDYLSSTTISSGSYVSTDPEQHVDGSRLCRPTGPGSGGVSCFRDSSVSAGPPVDSVSNDSVIQRIIDKYTRELDVSLSAAGTTTDSDALEESGSSFSQPSRTEDETSARRRDVRRHPVAGQDPNPEQTTPGHPTLERFCPINPEQNPSCLAPERLSVLDRLVGQPSAQSSMIGARPGPSGRSGWDSTLSRMFGRLSQQSDYPGFCAGQDTSEPSWSDELPEEVRMKVLVGELQVSADQHSESSETSRVSSGERSSAESRESSGLHRRLAQSPPTSVPVLQNRAGLEELDPTDDSFHPLHPEITHNETADPSVTFHLPDLNTSDDPSLEQLRAEEPDGDVQESFTQLVISEGVQQDSVLMVSCTSPGTAPCVSPGPGTASCGFREASALGPSETESSSVSSSAGEPQDFSTSEISAEPDGERGILEQSQITLVSLTDTTLQDAVATDDEGLQDSDCPDSITDGQETMETEPTEGAESTLAHQMPSASVLEFLWSPSRNLQDVFQQRRRALMQRSARRVQEMRAKRAAARNGPPSRVLVEGRDPGRARVQTVPRTETAESQSKTEDRKGAERKLRPPAPGRLSGPQIGADVRICDLDQRKRNLSEMHQRTQRLYEQLEEVKQQRAARSQQEDWARNRLRAKEFHRKTLQKLRAKQTPTF